MGVDIRQETGSLRGNAVRLTEDKTGNTVGYGDSVSDLRSVLRFSIPRTQAPGTYVGALPPSATPLGIRYVGPSTSNCSTTATIVVGMDTTSNFFLVATAVQIALTGLGVQTPTAAQMGVPFPLGVALSANEHPVTAGYAEAGTTSTTGGPWTVEIDYSLP